jgi:hypothetical protein
MGLLGHLSQQDKELIEAGVHPLINRDYTTKEKHEYSPKEGKNKKEKVFHSLHEIDREYLPKKFKETLKKIKEEEEEEEQF